MNAPSGGGTKQVPHVSLRIRTRSRARLPSVELVPRSAAVLCATALQTEDELFYGPSRRPRPSSSALP